MKIVITKSGHASKPFLERICLVQGNIAKQNTDAIAIVIPQNLDFKGRTIQSVREAAGVDLDEFILEHVYKPRAGEVYALPSFNLPARHIFLGIMPVYRTEFDMNEAHLSGITRKFMELARCMLLKSISFPPLYAGRKHFPKPKAARLIVQGIADRIDDNFEEVRLVCPDAEMIDIFHRKLEIAAGQA